MKTDIFQILLGLLILLPVNHAFADISPMVERHIFTPGNVVDQKEAGLPTSHVPVEKLQKELLFTGLMITPKGKYAMISENQKSDNIKIKSVFKEGEQIKGMIIKEIGANYILLAGKESDMRLNLYKGTKNRPAFDTVASMSATQSNTTSAAQSQFNQKIETTQQGQTGGLPKSELKPVFPSGNPLQGLPAASRGAGTSQQGSPAASGGETSQQGLPTTSGGGVSEQGLPVFGGGNIPQHAFPPTGGPQFVLPPIGGSQQGLPQGGAPLK